MSKQHIFIPRMSLVFTVADIEELKQEYVVHYYSGADVLIVDDEAIDRYDEVYFKYKDEPEGEPEPDIEEEQRKHDANAFIDVLRNLNKYEAFWNPKTAGGIQQELLDLVIQGLIKKKTEDKSWPWQQSVDKPDGAVEKENPHTLWENYKESVKNHDWNEESEDKYDTGWEPGPYRI